ncbi:MAG: hypothetical protein IPO09_03550 [Anaeromyxobacter sp.]|nr:hypothetical protein [Anaeromyxobacter sp.]MBL0275660.1 hypothetical protein [Anaeromyxobacter sp.]
MPSTSTPSAPGRLAAAALAALLLSAAPTRAPAAEGAPPPARVETDDEALKDITRAVKARDVEALLSRVSGDGVDRGESMISAGWVERFLSEEGSPVQAWVFGARVKVKAKDRPTPAVPGKEQARTAAAPKPPAPIPAFTMAACLAGEVTLVRQTAEDAQVRCSRGADSASFGLKRIEGRWVIVRDFFWPY